MTLQDKLAAKKAITKFLKDKDWKNPVAVTLTFKQRRAFPSEGGFFVQPLTLTEAEQTVRRFRRILDKKIFGNAAYRYRKRCQFFGAFEGHPGSNLHYHCVIDRPNRVEPFQFEMMIRDSWLRCNVWGNVQIHIERNSDNGWLHYCAKLRGKSDYARDIDWSNAHFA